MGRAQLTAVKSHSGLSHGIRPCGSGGGSESESLSFVGSFVVVVVKGTDSSRDIVASGSEE
jgi:hypothetical protein